MAADPPASEITTRIDADGHEVVVVVAGEIDLLTAPDFEAALRDGEQRGSRLLVDVREVTFMDSTGLRTLLEARNRALEAGGEMGLSYAENGAVARLLGLAGVTDLFTRRDGR